MDVVLKSILKRQLPYLMEGTITGIIMTYYYGFLLVNKDKINKIIEIVGLRIIIAVESFNLKLIPSSKYE